MKLIKKVLFLAAGLSVAMCNLAHAGGAGAENYFDGVYGQVEVGMGSITNNLGLSAGGSSLSFPFGYTAAMYAATVGYSKQIADLEGVHDLNLAVNISYNGTNGNSGSIKAAGISGSPYITMKQKIFGCCL